MLQFQPPGFGQRAISTRLGVMAYYTPTAAPWPEPDPNQVPLIFLHSLGGGSSAYEWSKVYPAFATDYRVIAPDLIGWGQSSHPQRDYQIEDYFGMVTDLIEQIGSPAMVVASSLTAGLMIRLSIQRPDLFRSLFLVSPAGYADFGADYGQTIAAQVARIPGVDRLIYTLGAANEMAVRQVLEQVLFAERSRLTPETVAAYLASAQQLNGDYAALSSLRGDLCFDLSRYMAQLSVPTAIAWGERAVSQIPQGTRLGTPDAGRRLAQLNPTAVTQVWAIPGVGLLPQLECPAIVIGLLRQALEHNRCA